MRGVVLTGEGGLVVKEFPDPQAGPGQVVVQLKASAICGSDLHTYNANKESIGRRGDIIQGHEPCGVVQSIGHGVTNVEPGDRVTVYHYLGCGHCQQCFAGNLMWCREARGLGSGANGGHADLLLVDERNALKLPDDLTLVDGAAIACIAGTTYSALSKIVPSGRDTLAVFGLGPVGLTGILFAKAMGARVIGIGRREDRLRIARELGADEIINIDEVAETGRTLQKLTAGQGVDAAYETSGSSDAYTAMFQGLKRGGQAVVVAGARFHSTKPFTAGPIVGKQLTVTGSFVMPISMYGDLTSFMLCHSLHFEPMVTHRFALEEAAEAFALFDSGECGKVIFEWPD